MSGKCRASLRAKTLENVKRSLLSQADKNCIAEVFERYEKSLDLINRKNAEIERLKSHSGKCIYLSDDETTEFCVEGACNQFKTEGEIRAEAIKEVLGYLKDHYTVNLYQDDKEVVSVVSIDTEEFDQIAKEMGVEL